MAGLTTFTVPVARAELDEYEPLGRVDISGATEAVVSEDGRTAYVAAGSGFATVDVSDPAEPTILAERRDLLADRETGPMEDIIDIKVDGDRLVIPGPGNPTSDEVVTGFLLYDVSNPATPVQLAFYETRAPIHNAFIDDDRVYLTQGESVRIVDVSGDAPVGVGTVTVTDFDPRWSDVSVALRRPHDVWVQDRIAYLPLWDAGTWIVDTTDPASPSPIAHIEGRPVSELASMSTDEARVESIEAPGNHHYVQPSADGRLVAIGKESWDAEVGDEMGGPSGIELWDISRRSAPRQLSEIHPPRAENETRAGAWTTAHNFDVVGDRLYSAWYRGGVMVHDVSDPSEPTALAWWRDPDRTAFWTAVHANEEFFVASSADIAGPTVTEGVFTFPTQPGEQADPPSAVAPARPPSKLATTSPSPTAAPVHSPTRDSAATDSGGQPGFGPVCSIAGVAAWLWWRLRDPDDVE